ncbi:hypothetical protein [Anatilimnocola floriformis]|uniref:hypothetical protein n=1 Tax=Anatilimnocola floriformis TaxID=2948575 RepID=UPI0020C3B64E|nr:hypothetical protein [Anatilimnocola floriformis]
MKSGSSRQLVPFQDNRASGGKQTENFGKSLAIGWTTGKFRTIKTGVHAVADCGRDFYIERFATADGSKVLNKQMLGPAAWSG